MAHTVAGAVFSAVMLITMLSPPVAAGEIHKLSKAGDIEKLGALLAGGGDINELDGSGATPLFEAAKWGKPAAVKLLLEAGADPLISAKGPFGSLGSPLHAAAKGGHLDVVQQLLDAGVDPNLPDAGSGPPLHVALARNRTEVAELLRSKGAKPIVAEPVDTLIAGADLALGKTIAGTCRTCHILTKDGGRKVGPPLWDVVGRKKASLEGFVYSKSLLALGGVWDYADLNSFVANPRGFLPGTKMSALSGIASPERRAALIAYLRSLSDTPKPLP